MILIQIYFCFFPIIQVWSDKFTVSSSFSSFPSASAQPSHSPPSHSPHSHLPPSHLEKDCSEIAKRKNWKDHLHLLHGTAGLNVGGPSYSADVDIVAFNVAKHITSVDLS